LRDFESIIPPVPVDDALPFAIANGKAIVKRHAR